METRKLLLPSDRIDRPEESEYGEEPIVHCVVADLARGERVRTLVDCLDDDILELHWADGLVEVLRVDDYARRTAASADARSGSRDPGSREIVVGLHRGDVVSGEPAQSLARSGIATRGEDVPLSELSIVRFPERLLAELLAKSGGGWPAFIQQVELHTTLRGVTRGLVSVGADGKTLTPITGPLSTPNGRVLLLVHGTFSHALGAFGDLLSGPQWRSLRERYDAVLAFQHYSLGESPAENARALAIALDATLEARPVIDVVSHSRGGLVAECLIAAGCARWSEVVGAVKDLDAETRAALSATRLESPLVFGRFARVACPVRGTSLLSTRVDRLASAAFTMARLAGAGASPWFQAAKFFVRFLLKLRRDPSAVPGLAAMDPASRLLAVVNDPRCETHVTVGELRGSTTARGPLSLLKVGAARVLFGRENDLVVDTEAMSGGAKPTELWQCSVRSAEIDHFTYFSNSVTSSAVVDLLRGSAEPSRAWARPELDDEASRGAAVRAARRLTCAPPDPHDQRPCIVLVPGIMGSRLATGGRSVWFEYGPLIEGGFEALAAVPGTVDTDGLMAEGYEQFAAHFGKRYDVQLFPYDWRRSVVESGALLAAFLESLLAASHRKIHVVAHSMGGLVVRGSLLAPTKAGTDGLDERIARRGGRIMMAGTPNGGSYEMLHLVAEERDTMLRTLALIDVRHDLSQLAQMVRGFPGVLEMLPWDGADDWQLASSRAWRAGAAPRQEALDAARQVQARLATALPKHLIYLAGTASDTMDRIVREGPQGPDRYTTTTAGDGRVTHAKGIPRGAEAYYVNALHGDLLATSSAFDAISELLETGRTTRLPNEPIAPTFFASVRRWFGESREASYRPTQRELRDLLLCSSPDVRPAMQEPPLHCTVLADGVHEAQFPVVVGHFAFDAISGPERVLDEQLGGALGRRYAVGRYARGLGSAVVHLDACARPEGAIVVGLGDARGMSERLLCEAVCAGVLEYVFERPDATGVSSLLVGRNTTLTVEQSVRGVLSGVREANRRLARLATGLRIVRVEFVEITEAYAGQALRELVRLEGQWENAIRVQRDLRRGRSVRKRLMPRTSDRQWMAPVVVDAQGDVLAFHLLTDRAKADHTVTHVPLDVVNAAVATMSSSTTSEVTRPDRAPLGYVLYRLLLPDGLRSALRDGAGLQLVLNPGAASIPWEMLEDSPHGEGAPPSVVMQMTRQLAEVPSPNAPPAHTRRAVVLADLEKDQHPLPRAADEGRAVAQQLRRAEFNVSSSLVQPDAAVSLLDALQILLADDVDILHIATHGSVEAASARIHLGEGRFLGSEQVEQLGYAPRLVFLNCCHLGVNRDPAAFASNIARAFIRAGASAVIAAGWAVNDAAAATFSRALYTELLRGATLGEAALSARAQTYAQHAGSNTWGAYQVYGHPTFRLVHTAGAEAPDEELYTEGELHARIDHLHSELHYSREAQRTGPEALASIRRAWEDLEARRQCVPEDGRIYEKLGKLWLLLFRPREAIEAFEAALHDPERRASMNLREDLLDAHTRNRRRLYEEHGRNYPKLAPAETRAADQAQNDLELLMRDRTQITAGRCSAVASAYKERSRVGGRRDVAARMLRKSYEWYQRSLSLYPMRSKHYPLTVLLLLERVALAHGSTTVSEPHQLIEELAVLRRHGTPGDRDGTSASATLAHANTYLIAHLDYALRPDAYAKSSSPHATRECVAGWFRYAFATVLTPWERDSNLQVMRWMLDVLPDANHAAQARESLRVILEELVQTGPMSAANRGRTHERPRPPEQRIDWVQERLENKAGMAVPPAAALQLALGMVGSVASAMSKPTFGGPSELQTIADLERLIGARRAFSARPRQRG